MPWESSFFRGSGSRAGPRRGTVTASGDSCWCLGAGGMGEGVRGEERFGPRMVEGGVRVSEVVVVRGRKAMIGLIRE